MPPIRYFASIMAIATVLGSASAVADTRIVYVDEKTGAERTVIAVKDGKVRMDSADTDSFSLYDSDTDVLTLVEPDKRSYTRLDEESLRALSGEMNDAMARMREQMQRMPPEQRAAMKKMMGGAPDAAKAPAIKVDRTGKVLNKGGHECRQLFLSSGDVARMELCVVDRKVIDMPDDDRATLDAMQEQMKIVAESFAGGSGHTPLDYGAIGGMPVFMKSSAQRSGEVLKSVTHGGIDVSLFEVPAGFRETKIGAGSDQR